jgi:hypothetical protein
MKRPKVWLVVLCLLIPCLSFAIGNDSVVIDGNTASGDFTSSYLVVTGAGTLKKVVINTDGTNDVTLVIRDSVTASAGKVVFRGTCPGVSISAGKNTCATDLNVNYDTGLYGNVTTSATTNTYYNVEYRTR